MQQKETAFVFITCSVGQNKSVIKQLEGFDSITNVDQTFGAYDIVARIEDKDQERIKGVIARKIHKIPNIRTALTLWSHIP